MKKIIITEKQRGLLFKNGKFIKMLEAGKYLLTCGKSIEVLPFDQPIASKSCALETLLENKELASRVAICEVGDTELAIHYVNGKIIVCCIHIRNSAVSYNDRNLIKSSQSVSCVIKGFCNRIVRYSEIRYISQGELR